MGEGAIWWNGDEAQEAARGQGLEARDSCTCVEETAVGWSRGRLKGDQNCQGEVML
jgi:hypothetical protein